MGQPEPLRTRTAPKTLYCAAILLALIATALGVREIYVPHFIPKSIKWYSMAEAPRKARELHKPILYLFSAEWCPPCKKMETIAFARKDISNLINQHYVPVLIMDQEREAGMNPPEIDKLEKHFKVNMFPTLISVHPDFIDQSFSTQVSSGNKAERALALPSYFSTLSSIEVEEWDDWLEGSSDHIPGHTGYETPDELLQYLTTAYLWHRFRPDLGDIHWQDIALIDKPTKRPKLKILIDEYGRFSDRMRVRFFDDADSCKFINEHFEPFLVEFKRHTAPPALGIALKQQLAIKQQPAIVVDDGIHSPQVVDGFRNRKLTLQFLCRCVGVDEETIHPKDSKAKAGAATEEYSDYGSN